MQKKQKYPIGIQSFEELRTGGYEYIDKTEFIFNLIDSGKYYFLSRPRRFGKSLLVETMRSFFLAQKQLFEGLYIEDKMEWKQYPLIHISFTNVSFAGGVGLEKALSTKLHDIAKSAQVAIEGDNVGGLFEKLIVALQEKHNEKVVILIDEYDTPIVHYLPNDIEEAQKNREILKNFYSCIKGLDNKIRFFFLTGITQFSKMSLFSTLNNLRNISMDTAYSALCGYTENELLAHFSNRIAEIASKKGLSQDALVMEIKDMYNGFDFATEEGISVYNPFSILNFMQRGVFNNYWFESGTPTFLVKMLKNGLHYQIDNVEMSMNRIKSFDIEALDYGALLYQTGYITIKERIDKDLFLMGYPNAEVKDSMLQWLLGEYTSVAHGQAEDFILILRNHLSKADAPKIELCIRSFFSKVPADLFKKSMENFYHAITFLMFELLGCKMNVEVSHANGRTDAVVETDKYIYIFEFKINRSAKAAIAYIYKQQYYLPYLNKNKAIYLIGINFTEKAKGVAHFIMESIKEESFL